VSLDFFKEKKNQNKPYQNHNIFIIFKNTIFLADDT
jgi:hypothetical protein